MSKENEMRIRESIEKEYGPLSGPMTLDEFFSELDSLDAEDEEDRGK